jgi:hypothetical protein
MIIIFFLLLFLLLGKQLSVGFHIYGKLKRALGCTENEGMQKISVLAFCTVHRNFGQKATSSLTYGKENEPKFK